MKEREKITKWLRDEKLNKKFNEIRKSQLHLSLRDGIF